ncbi:MAG: RDD family protein [Gammaproteobacteria bacterium]|nr:RDD family protein [Pseudomonadales bacterium]MCP5346694.1 RDD family protein [Pseudomonadales bacterium]
MSITIDSIDLPALPGAGLFRRLAALLYDGFLVVAIWMLVGLILQIIFGTDTNHLENGVVETDPVLGRILFAAMLLSATGFYVWFWCKSGQTLGMLAWRLRVQDLQGNLLTPGRALLRLLLAWPSFFLFGAGYLWVLVDRDHTAVHDRLSGTRVVLLPKEFQPLK